jgi:DNA repair protein RecN (Recombination protein N)
MLLDLRIKDLALIEEMEIGFSEGLNIITGETGAGKSILLLAIQLLLGGRTTADLVRSGKEEAVIEGIFRIPREGPLPALLSEMGVAPEEEVVIRRVITRAGRSRLLVNGTAFTLPMMARLAPGILAYSGQHAAQTLLNEEVHREILDQFAGTGDQLLELSRLYHHLLKLKEDQVRLKEKIRQRKAQEDLLQFQVKEIESADIYLGEDLELEARREKLKNLSRIVEAGKEALWLLYEGESSIQGELAKTLKALDRALPFDRNLANYRQRLETAEVEVGELSLELRDYVENLHLNPGELEALEDRLALLNQLKKKYGPTLEEVVSFEERVRAELAEGEKEEEDLAALEREIGVTGKAWMEQARMISGARQKAAKTLTPRITAEMAELGMNKARFEVRLTPLELFDDLGIPRGGGHSGLEQAAFWVTLNPGEPLKPLSRTASGGELSRILLALKGMLAGGEQVESLVFDEVDAGIGGGLAGVVGKKLKDLSQYHQLFCITHLPQIACFGKAHFMVRKGPKGGRTITEVSRLSEEERVSEIARMLGGSPPSEAAVKHARELLLMVL